MPEFKVFQFFQGFAGFLPFSVIFKVLQGTLGIHKFMLDVLGWVDKFELT